MKLVTTPIVCWNCQQGREGVVSVSDNVYCIGCLALQFMGKADDKLDRQMIRPWATGMREKEDGLD